MYFNSFTNTIMIPVSTVITMEIHVGREEIYRIEILPYMLITFLILNSDLFTSFSY